MKNEQRRGAKRLSQNNNLSRCTKSCAAAFSFYAISYVLVKNLCIYHDVIYTELLAMPFLPLSNAALYILLALSKGERHGYIIMKEVAELSGGSTVLGPATLYTTLKRLLADGLITEVGERPDSESNRPHERRRYYALTDQGAVLVKEELTRMDHLVRKFKSTLA